MIDSLKDKRLLEAYREHVQHVADLVGKEYAKGTLKRCKTAFSSLEVFMQYTKMEDIKARELNHKPRSWRIAKLRPFKIPRMRF